MRDWSQTSGSSPQNWHDFGSSPGQRGILTGVQLSNRASIASNGGGGEPREVTWRDRK
jgi:hypothetical protein